MRVLEGKGVTKRFGGLLALREVDFHVNEKEIAGLIGPNGAGKTTLFNVITGALRPTAGTIKFRDSEITGLKPCDICRLGIARTFQTPKPFPRMSVYENVLAAALFGRCREERKGKADLKGEIGEVLEKLRLSKKSSEPAQNLTVFEQRMLEVARALITKPRVLLLDEVMAGLNPKETEEIIKVVQEIREGGVTVFMIEHNMRAVMGLSDRVIVLSQGSKIAEGRPEEVCRDVNVIEAYLGREYVGN